MGDTTKTVRNLAQQVAKQVAQEPVEILKQAKEQIASNAPVESASQTSQLQVPSEKTVTSQEVQKKQAKARSLYRALENELSEIQTREAQKEQAERQPEPQEVKRPLIEPATRRSRRLIVFGPKSQAEKQKTRVEKPLPPSG